MEKRYFDWAATTPMSQEAITSYAETAAKLFGNPSSQHSIGKEAHKKLEEIRNYFAQICGTESDTIFFTSGGTESNALICQTFLAKKRNIHIVISGIEHPSIYEYVHAFRQRGHEVTRLPAPNGLVDLQKLKTVLTKQTALVMVMTVNNVMGTIQPIKEIRSILREHERTHGTTIHFHTDAVQAFGKIDPSLYVPFVDSISISAHKLQGPKGTGVLYSRTAPQVPSPGGGQEGGIRPGTQDLPSIVSFYTAARYYVENLSSHLDHAASIKRRLIQLLQNKRYIIPITPTTDDTHLVSPYIISLSIPGIPSEVFARVLDSRGICISTGSACSSKSRKKIQRVLLQSGFSEEICDSAIRISFGPETTFDDIDMLAACMIEEAETLLGAVGKRM